MDSPEELYESGIYVNDLSMHDSSRDMILAGSQKDPELKIALSQVSVQSQPCLHCYNYYRRRSEVPSWRRASSRQTDCCFR